jgi:putative copper resistance protein D
VVAILLVSGFVNSWFLIGAAPWRTLFRSTYGLVLTAKVALFGLMLALAAMHRYRTVPALQITATGVTQLAPNLRRLQTSLSAETVLALLVLAAAAVLGTLEPPGAT